jgi:hypothetical protein
VIADLSSDLDRVIAHREQLATEIETVFMAHPLGMVLVTLCGFGPRTGARTLAEIGDPQSLHRWWPPRRLRRPRTRRPTIGTLHQLVVAIPMPETTALKNAVFLAAFVAAQHDPTAKAYYQRKRAEGKKHNAAVICLARKRCDIILAMLKNATPYQQPAKNENLPQAA